MSSKRQQLLVAMIVCGLCMGRSVVYADGQRVQPFLGVTIYKQQRQTPRPLAICVAEIDLAADGISFLVTPGNGDPNGDEPGDPNNETTRQTTLSFLEQQQAQLAVNATFFGMKEIDTDNIGLVVSQGRRVSPFRGDWPAINIDSENNASIVRGIHDTFQTIQQKPEVSLYNAVSGSDQIVTAGKPTTDNREFSTTAHPRTAIGYTPGRRLFLVAVDGRQPGVSEGMQLSELADLMLSLGCVEALNLDGGGSTTMAVADPVSRVLNTPSSKNEHGDFGMLRKNGTNIAVFALPNPEFKRSHARETLR